MVNTESVYEGGALASGALWPMAVNLDVAAAPIEGETP